MNSAKNWLVTLATVNIIILFISGIVVFFFGGFGLFFNLFIIRWYKFLMLFSSLLAFYRYVAIATVLQVFGCVIQGLITFLFIGIAMAFENRNFWEVIVNNPLDALEIYSFFGFCVIAVGFLILSKLKFQHLFRKQII